MSGVTAVTILDGKVHNALVKEILTDDGCGTIIKKTVQSRNQIMK